MSLYDQIRRGRLGNKLKITGAPSQTSYAPGDTFAFQPVARGGKGAKSFSYTGTLPPGLSFSTTTGAVTGTFS